ncbi:MAG: hypothetical protein [Bacteriophage sp.]|nr:MAG: hypothetical protein [Bacteriophage sp.]
MPDYYAALLDHLWWLKQSLAGGLDQPHLEAGICFTLECEGASPEAYEGWDVLSGILQSSWPEWSGGSWYPVPGPEPKDRYSADRCFAYALTHGGFWRGAYGSARIRLVNHCINQLQQAVDTGVEL